jgi:hypothetical protein
MNLLPVWISYGVSILIFGIGIFLVAVHTSLATQAAARAAVSARARTLAPILIAAYLAAWLGVGIVVGDRANFAGVTDAQRLPLALAVGVGPMILGAAILFSSSAVRALNAAMPPDWLIRVQLYRVAGAIFLYPLLYYRVLPAEFALPAGIGDLLTGLLAPWVASQVAHRRPAAFALALVWNLFGIADLIVAPVTAVVSQTRLLSLYPLDLIALFVGPPIGILTHIYSLRNLAVSRLPAQTGPSIREPASAT